MSDVLNPVDVENAIKGCADRIHRGVRVCTDAETDARARRREYELALAQAYMNHEGPAHEKKYAAEIATAQLREYAETAEIAYKYADRTAKAVENELRAWQSVGASVRAMYAAESRT